MLNKFIVIIANLFFRAGFTLYNSVDDFVLTQEKKKEEKETSRYKHTIGWILRLLMPIIFLLIGLLLFNGCSAKQEVVTKYEPVYLPQACEVEMPNKPTSTGDVVKDNLLILQYSENLKLLLESCKKK